jgi:hypothetical protein
VGSSRIDPETRIRVQRFIFLGGFRESWQGVGKMGKEGKQSAKAL